MDSWRKAYERAHFPTTRSEVDAFTEIAEYSVGKLEQACAIAGTFDEVLNDAYQKHIFNIGQQRDTCTMIGVKNYSSLPLEDMMRIKTAALYRVYLEQQSMPSPP